MSDKFDETLSCPEESPAGETESPGTSGAPSDACVNTSSIANPGLIREPESVSNLTSNLSAGNTGDFNISDIRLSQDYPSMVGVKKVTTNIRVGKPDKHVFFRVRSGEDWRLPVFILEIKEDRENYIVRPSVYQNIAELVTPKVLHTCITRDGVVFLLPVKLPRPEDRSDSWNDSRIAAAELAQHKWIRMAANISAGVYDIYEATGNIPEPEWPADLTFEEILKIAFKGRIIDRHDHPVLRRLRGEL